MKRAIILSMGFLTVVSLVVGPGVLAASDASGGKSTDEPKYGGVLKMIREAQELYFDDAIGHFYYAQTTQLTNEALWYGDWSKGPAGSNETSWFYLMQPAANVRAGCLAESWEFPDDNTVVFHIRKGVHFHNKPPTNGREMTADDVVFSLKRLWTAPKSYQGTSFPWKTHFQDKDGEPWIEATDKWTVVIKCLPGQLGKIFERAGSSSNIVPRDAVEAYGDLSDWKHAIGTGGFVLTDYIPGSVATFERFDNYWNKDPLHPGNQLPYLDGVKWLYIADQSTRLASLRTGKVDLVASLGVVIGWEDAKDLERTCPRLQMKGLPTGTAAALFWRIDRKPFDDIRVRRALCMAIDNQEIIDTVYGGQADIMPWPLMNIPDFADIRTPLAELPQSTRELYEFHPEKAKKLLTEAGYPNGFKTGAVCEQGGVDMLSILKNYFANIGVEMEIDVREHGAYISVNKEKKFDQMFYGGVNNSLPFQMFQVQPGHFQNTSMVNDPKINEAREKIAALYFDEPKMRQVMKDITPYMISQALFFQAPAPYQYNVWQPWVKGYHGEYQVGYNAYLNFPVWLWLDPDLKQEPGGK